MLTAEFPMLTAETDISDDDTEITEALMKRKVNRVGENILTSDGTSSTKHVIAQSPRLDAESISGSSCNDTNNEVHLSKNDREGASNKLEITDNTISLVNKVSKEKSSTGFFTDEHSTCHSIDNGVQVGSNYNLRENLHTSSSHRNPTAINNVSSIPTVVERKTSVSSNISIRSRIDTSKDSIESNKNITEDLSTQIATVKNNNLSKTNFENDVTTAFPSDLTIITSTNAQQHEKAPPLEIVELLPKKKTEGSLQIHNTHHRQQTPVELMTRQIVSMGTSSHVHSASPLPRQESTQESFLITVPRNSQYMNSHNFNNNSGMPFATVTNDNQRSYGRRSIRLRLVEDKDPSEFFNESKRSFFTKKFTRARSLNVVDEHRKDIDSSEGIITDLGTIVVSWYQGTTSKELQTHVRNSVFRKLGKKVEDIRLLDEDVIPHEEIVLTPFIPDGSRFMVKFRYRPTKTPKTVYFASKAPDSPSRAPTPYDSEADLASDSSFDSPELPYLPNERSRIKKPLEKRKTEHESSDKNEGDDNNEIESENIQNKTKHRFKKRNLEKLLSKKTTISDEHKVGRVIYRTFNRTEEKKHVVFVLANYFVLFLSIIAISAEIHERGPRWMQWVEDNVDRVNACAVDRDSLFECVSNGDFSGLLASIVLWVARNNTLTTRFFLFGFDSVNKLWTVVYEALVTAICWGTSYIFIRRGLNPDTRANFLEKYWKDAIYGSLAGFNAAFLKAVLKNLIPKEVLEEIVDNNRQLRIIELIGRVILNKKEQTN